MIQLTPCQANAEKVISNFLSDPTQQCLVLDGAPGTGKSTLITHLNDNLDKYNIIRKLINEPEINSFSVTATTNKAATVIDGHTIYSHLGLFPRICRKTGKEELVNRDTKSSIKNQVLIIDEASMLSEDVISQLEPYLKGNKVIYSLDRYQLPPVGSSNIPLVDGRYPLVTLKTPVRFKDDTCTYALTQELRQCIDNNSLPKFENIFGNVKIVSPAEAYEVCKDKLHTMVHPNDFKMLAFTNKKVSELNSMARSILGLPAELSVGGIVTVNKFVLSPDHQTSLKTDSVHRLSNLYSNSFKVVGCNKSFFYMSAQEYKKRVKEYREAKDWSKLHEVQTYTTTLDFHYACTIHKSQGSTYKDTMICFDDLRKALRGDRESKDLYLRLLLVALSRSTGDVYVVTE